MEKNSKLLSVIVPVYKAENYLHRCVDSILAQTWSNLEVILVDDGSPDDSGKICDEYSAQDERVRVIHKPNGGVSSARNAGIDAAKGEYIAFVDSDDYIAPDMYEKLFGAISSTRSIAVCDFMMDFGNGHLEPKTTIEVGNSTLDAIRSLLLSDVGGGSVYMISPRCVVGDLRFPEYMQAGEDLWFVLRLFSNAESIEKIPLPLYYYDHSNLSSLTHSVSYPVALGWVKGFCENKAFLIDKGLFSYVEKEWSWSALRFKSLFAVTPDHLNDFRELIPEANSHITDCPFLSKRIKLLMHIINNRLDFVAKLILWVNDVIGHRN